MDQPALWWIALLNKPFAKGDAIKCATLVAPAYSPEIVIFSGSPPTLAIFFLTQFNDSIKSSNAKLDAFKLGCE